MSNIWISQHSQKYCCPRGTICTYWDILGAIYEATCSHCICYTARIGGFAFSPELIPSMEKAMVVMAIVNLVPFLELRFFQLEDNLRNAYEATVDVRA